MRPETICLPSSRIATRVHLSYTSRSSAAITSLYAAATLLNSTLACGCGSESPSPQVAAPLTAPDAGADASGDSGDAAPETGVDAAPDAVPLAGYPAVHATLPRVETFGGPVLRAPNVIPVFFSDYSLQPQIEQFLSQLEGSSYWTATTGEYGVGALRVASSVVVTDAPPPSIGSADVASWLAGYLGAGQAGWPPIDDNNIYVVFYPRATSISVPNGMTSCKDFGGFHSEGFAGRGTQGAADGGAQPVEAGDETQMDASEGGASDADAISAADGAYSDVTTDDAESAVAVAVGPRFVFAVIPRCTSFNSLSGIDDVTGAASHELVEAATDPFTVTDPAYSHVDYDHLAWDAYLGGSELADMCMSETVDRLNRPLVGDFMVQRTWSNRAAELGQDPCVPGIADVYINGAPDFDDAVVVPNPGSKNFPNLVTMGAYVPVAESRTIDVRLFSTAPTPDWSVRAEELIAPEASATLKFSWDKLSGNNGDVFKLTITRTATGPDGGSAIFLQSYRTSADRRTVSGNLWAGLITE